MLLATYPASHSSGIIHLKFCSEHQKLPGETTASVLLAVFAKIGAKGSGV